MTMQEKEVWIFLWREDKRYVAYEPTTGIASQGNTIDEALDNIREALELYFEEPDVEEPYPIQRVSIMKIKIRIPAKRKKAIVTTSHT